MGSQTIDELGFVETRPDQIAGQKQKQQARPTYIHNHVQYMLKYLNRNPPSTSTNQGLLFLRDNFPTIFLSSWNRLGLAFPFPAPAPVPGLGSFVS